MMVPGRRLRAMAARLFSARAIDRLIDPVLADMQAEYCDARAGGRKWGSRWVRLAGYVAFLKVVGVVGSQRVLQSLRDWPGDDRHTLGRAIRISAVAFVAVTVLLILPVLRAPSNQTYLAVFLIPQSLPIAIPVGLTLGIVCGIGGRVVSSRLTGAVLALALAGSFASLVATMWIIPAAGQAFRASVARRIHVTTGARATLTKGATELTLSELSQRIELYNHDGRTNLARRFAHAYHMRWALPLGTFALALFALSVTPRRPVSRPVLVLAAVAICLSYYALMVAGKMLGHQGTVPAFVGGWFPNVVFVVTSAALLIGAKRSCPCPEGG